MANSPAEGMASLIRNLEEKTGVGIDEWVARARATGLGKHAAIVAQLKKEYGLSHGYANQIGQRALATDRTPEPLSDGLIEAQYAGKKAGLRPIYDALVEALGALGPDVELAPKKLYVSVRRSKQFALIQASTASRVDLGLILRGVAPSGRLEASGSFNAMFTHRVRIASVGEVDPEVLAWLRAAYESA